MVSVLIGAIGAVVFVIVIMLVIVFALVAKTRCVKKITSALTQR